MPWRVCLSGLPGEGKSMIAHAPATEAGALRLRVDRVEQALRESHMGTEDLADGDYAALFAVAAAALEQGFDVVANSVNAIPLTRRDWQAASATGGGLNPDVEQSCADRAAHRQRVETRVPQVPGLGMPDRAAVRARRSEIFPGADLYLDTDSLSVTRALAATRAALAERSHG